MLKLNPHLPVLWRDPYCIQIGTDPAVLILDRVTTATERFIAALQTGISDGALSATAEQCGLSPEQAHTLLEELSPALEQPAPPRVLRVAIDGDTIAARRLSAALATLGHHVVYTAARTSPPCDVAFVVGDFVLEPHRCGDWLRRGVTHVPVVLTETRIHLGPAINTPGAPATHSPCYQCTELARRDADPAWIALATQLLSVDAPVLEALPLQELTAVVSRWCLSPEDSALASDTEVLISYAHGVEEVRNVSLHPECACQALPRNVSVLDSSRGQLPEPPRTD